MDDDLAFASLLDVSGRIAAGALSPVALTQAMLARIARIDPGLHSFLAVTGEEALAAARIAEAEIRAGQHRGPLHGVPIAIKDIFHTAGTPSTFGSLAYRGFTAEADATPVQRLRAAGAVILGRLHLHEGAFGEHHPALPRCLNPWSPDYWPGGSSSGSGAAPAAGLCFGTLGTDTGGSIRFPSAANGITGLKPTWGRTSRQGVFPLAPSLDTIGPMARSAADAAALMDVLAGPDPLDPTSLSAPVPDHLGGLAGILGARGLRIAVEAGRWEAEADGETRAALEGVIAGLSEIGARIVPVTVPDRRGAVMAQITITDAEAALFHRPAFEADPALFGPQLRACIERGLGCDPTNLAQAYIERDRFKGEVARWFADTAADALLAPVLPTIGARYDEMDAHLADLQRFLGFTAPFNVSGNPCLTFPCGMADAGLPIGAQLIGPHLSEPVLLRAVHAFQQATDWHLRRPPHLPTH